MDEMINRILEIDKKAREMTGDAESERQKAESQIALNASKIHDEYLERANKRIELIEKNERTLAEEALVLKTTKNKELLDNLNSLFDKNADNWVEQITKRVLG